MGSCHDALTACQGCAQASEASPASRIFTALMKSALADSPHFRHTNFAWVLRLSAAIGKREQGFRTPQKLGDDDAGFFAFEFGSLRELATKEGDEAA